MSLQEQMASVLRNRGGSRGNMGRVKGEQDVRAAVKKPSPKLSPEADKKPGPSRPSPEAVSHSRVPQEPPPSGGNRKIGSENARMDEIKRQLEKAQDWQLRAIEKILS